MSAEKTITIGLISDTHDLLRPEAIAALQGCNHIIHAGDIGGAKILKELEAIAPVTAIRGNCDEEDWAMELPESAMLEVGELLFFLIHSDHRAGIDYPIRGYDVIISGHTHIPKAVVKNGILFVNPGSAGPIRRGKPVAIGRLVIEGKKVTPHLIELEV